MRRGCLRFDGGARDAARDVDMADAALLDWDRALTAEDVRGGYPESRFVTIGPIRGRLHVMAWCWRGRKLRVISLRKANAREVRRYEETLD